MEKVNYSKEVFNGVRTSLEMITPTMAAEYLATNKNNRKLNKTIVSRYVRSMEKGEWKMNGDTICFDRYGNLVNGQHRLSAIIQFGGAVPFLVVRGVQDGSFPAYDNGKNRTIAEVLDLDEVPNYSRVSSLLTQYFQLTRKRLGDSFAGTDVIKPSKPEYLNYYHDNETLIQNIINASEPIYRKYNLLEAKLIGGVFLYLVKIKKYDFDYVKRFFELFVNPYECDVDSINALRDKLIREVAGKTRLQNSIKIKYVMKAWNGYVLKKKMALLKLTPSELESIWFI